jgi:hypothetical protein
LDKDEDRDRVESDARAIRKIADLDNEKSDAEEFVGYSDVSGSSSSGPQVTTLEVR